MIKILLIRTKNKREVVDITDEIEKLIKDSKNASNCHLFLTHTTAGLTTADLDPGGTDQDYLDSLIKMIPEPKRGFRHPHNPAHMPAHILSSLVGTSLTLPLDEGKLVLGTWQRVVLMEFDGPKERKIIVSF